MTTKSVTQTLQRSHIGTGKMKFIDRMVADSRSIGLYHTSGLSTPQQMMEVLFSLTHLVNRDQTDPYIESSKKLVDTRYTDLLNHWVCQKMTVRKTRNIIP